MLTMLGASWERIRCSRPLPLTLTLEIGASVANFAVVRGVLLLRPLPYHDPARLVQVYEANQARDANMSAFSPQDLDDFARQQDVFEDGGAYIPWSR
jgi:putative ABC transport system permease protein